MAYVTVHVTIKLDATHANPEYAAKWVAARIQRQLPDRYVGTEYNWHDEEDNWFDAVTAGGSPIEFVEE